MALASLREDIWERFLSSTEIVPEPDVEDRVRCHICRASFQSEGQRLAHLATSHRSDAPALFLYGRIAADDQRIREALTPRQIAVANCTHAFVEINGGPKRLVAPEALAISIASEKDALVDITLVNEFDRRAQPIARRWRIRVGLAPPSDLRRVEIFFRETFAKSSISWDDVTRFRKRLVDYGSPFYGQALADYVHGVLVRDRVPGTVVPLEKHHESFNQALEELRWYDRPLPALICAVIRFAQNDFGLAMRPSGWARLDTVNRLLVTYAEPSTHTVVHTREAKKNGDAHTIPVCPIDAGIDEVLALSDRLQRWQRWSRAGADIVAKRTEASSLDVRDRAKMLALWALHALRLGDCEEATKPLRALDGDPTFGEWATHSLGEAAQ